MRMGRQEDERLPEPAVPPACSASPHGEDQEAAVLEVQHQNSPLQTGSTEETEQDKATNRKSKMPKIGNQSIMAKTTLEIKVTCKEVENESIVTKKQCIFEVKKSEEQVIESNGEKKLLLESDGKDEPITVLKVNDTDRKLEVKGATNVLGLKVAPLHLPMARRLQVLPY